MGQLNNGTIDQMVNGTTVQPNIWTTGKQDKRSRKQVDRTMKQQGDGKTGQQDNRTELQDNKTTRQSDSWTTVKRVNGTRTLGHQEKQTNKQS